MKYDVISEHGEILMERVTMEEASRAGLLQHGIILWPVS